MTLFPECQTKAQEELDRVIGRNRIPHFSDRSFLPYVDALVKEVFRWFPVAPSGQLICLRESDLPLNFSPIGLSHYTTEDDTYRGYLIPAQSMVLPNVWYGPVVPRFLLSHRELL